MTSTGMTGKADKTRKCIPGLWPEPSSEKTGSIPTVSMGDARNAKCNPGASGKNPR
jgi:hypothetical protein